MPKAKDSSTLATEEGPIGMDESVDITEATEEGPIGMDESVDITEIQTDIALLEARIENVEVEQVRLSEVAERVARLERCEMRRSERENACSTAPEVTTSLTETNEGSEPR